METLGVRYVLAYIKGEGGGGNHPQHSPTPNSAQKGRELL